MASLRPAFTQLRGRYRTSAPQCQQLRHMLQGLHISPKAVNTRPLSTIPSGPDDAVSKDATAVASEADRNATVERERPEWAPSESIASENMLGAPDAKDPAMIRAMEMTDSIHKERRNEEVRGREYGHRPLVERPPWGERPKRADQGRWVKGGSRGKDETSTEGKDGEEKESEDKEAEIHARAMPVSPSYFSRQPEFNDSYLLLQKLMRKYAHLPTVPSDQLQRVAFRTIKDYRLAVGEHVKASEYARCMTLVKRLNKIHPKLAPQNVKDAIVPFTRDINPYIHKAREIPVDKFGRTLGVGKRKTSVARAWVVEGVGEVLVNGKSLADAFGRIHDRESAIWALKATARTDKYNVWALVDGGGTTGQAEALAMAVGKALMAHEPALKPALRRAGVVTRDPRGVERKKHGHLKARKKPAWVKR